MTESVGPSGSMDLRRVQLVTDACCCRLLEYHATGGETVYSAGDDVYLGESFWCFVYVTGLTLKQGDKLAADVSLALPPNAWYYGVLEHHVDGEIGGHQSLHAFLGVLVGFGEPFDVETVRSAVVSYPLWVPVDSVSVEREWVRLAEENPSVEGMMRRTFGYSEVETVLEKQLGIDVYSLLGVSRTVGQDAEGDDSLEVEVVAETEDAAVVRNTIYLIVAKEVF
ncbi:hypothetical protein LX36DRAFT_705708 [Colletotrichum falcatum]|nr:hypothetical protein LX36DRAFT_705708 [Colletotrichum falcatum]